MEQSTKYRTKLKYFGLVTCLFLSALPVFGESKKAVPIISDKLLTAGVNFEIKFEIERLNYSEPTLVYARDPQGFTVTDPPIFSYNQENPETPGIVSVVLKSKTTLNGYFTVPIIYFNFPEGDQVLSEQTLLPIGLKAHPQFIPPDLEWQVSSGPFYRGQAIHVELRLLYAKGLLIPQKVQPPIAEGLSFTPSTYLSSSQDMQLAGAQFRAIPVLSYNVIAQRAGTLRLPEIKLEFSEFSRVVPAKLIQVNDVPISNSRALGSFDFNLVQDKTNWIKGQNIIVKLITRGRGNFSSFKPPAVQFGTLSLVNKETRFSTHETLLGTEGYREDVFTVKADNNGSYPIDIEGFSIFDTESGREKIIAPLSTIVKVVDATKNQIEESPSISALVFDSTRFGLSLFFVSLGLVIGCLCLKIKKLKVLGLLVGGLVTIAGLVHFATYFPFSINERFMSEIPKLYDSGNVDSAFNYLLAAMIKHPGNSDLLRFAQSVDFPSLGLQLPSLLLWIISSCLLLATGVFILLYKKGNKSVVYTLRFLAVSVCASFLVTGINYTNMYGYSGIIGHQGSQVRSITSVTAKPFSELTEGSVVVVIDTYREFSLVETSNHIKGWILSSDISKKPDGL